MSEYSEKLENYLSKILTLNENIWKLDLKGERIESWINEFTLSLAEEEREKGKLTLLHLLSQFMYFPIEEFRELLKATFFEYIQYPIFDKLQKKYQDKTPKDLEKLYKLELRKIKYVSIGNPSESSSLLYYFLRQTVQLDTESFITPWEIFEWEKSNPSSIADNKVTNYYFLDDLCGSGSQVIRKTKNIVEMAHGFNNSIKLNYLTLFSTQEGILKVEESGLFDSAISFYTLPASYKVFSESSRYFSNSEVGELDESKDMIERIGLKLYKKHPLGYNNTQLLLAFFYNTPNNTLPIFWKEQKQFFSDPIFKRFEKNYGKYSS